MNRKFTVFGLLVVASLVFSACAPAQPAPDASATYQSAVETAVATIFVGKTLEAAAVTQTPWIVTATPVPATQTPYIITATPMPTPTPVPVYLIPSCSDPEVIEFLIDNYKALNPNPPNLKFNKVMKEGLSHFNYKTNGDLAGIDRQGLDADKDKMKRLLDEVREVWAPPSLVQFQQQEINYLWNLWQAFWAGWKKHTGDAQEFKMHADYWRGILDASPVNRCGYRIFDP